jgi:hypothetical protein
MMDQMTVPIDDLEPDDRLEIDCGSDCIVGFFQRLYCEKGTWFIEVKNKKGKQIVPTKEVVRILRD